MTAQRNLKKFWRMCQMMQRCIFSMMKCTSASQMLMTSQLGVCTGYYVCCTLVKMYIPLCPQQHTMTLLTKLKMKSSVVVLINNT